MEAEKMGEKQVFLLAGIGLIIAQLMLSYLGLGGRSLVKSVFWFLKNRYKLSLYLCILSVLICRGLYGQVTDNSWYVQLCYIVMFLSITSYTWLTGSMVAGQGRAAARNFLLERQHMRLYAPRSTSFQ